MAGSRIGGLKAAKTNKEKYGDDFFAIQGAKGGSTPTTKPKGFAANRSLAAKAGKIGGEKSRRGKAKNESK